MAPSGRDAGVSRVTRAKGEVFVRGFSLGEQEGLTKYWLFTIMASSQYFVTMRRKEEYGANART